MRKAYTALYYVPLVLFLAAFLIPFGSFGTIIFGEPPAAKDSSPAPIFEKPVRYELEVTLDTPLNRGITMLTTVQPEVPFKMTTTNGSVQNTISGTLQKPVGSSFPLKLSILEDKVPILNDKGTIDYVLKLDWVCPNGKTTNGVISEYWVRLRPHKPDGYSRVIDDQPITPLAYHDARTGNYYYVESDGRHVCAFTPTGKVLWWRDPFTDSGLQPYRVKRPVIIYIGPSNLKYTKGNFIGIDFNSSQFGDLDATTGDFRFRGQD